MRTISFGGLAIVAAAALAAPLALGLFPRIRLPAIVLEIVLGIVIGPQVLGWVSIDTPIQVMSLLGLAFLLLLAGLEVEYERLRGRPLRLTALGYAISFGLAPLIGLGLHESGLVKWPLLIGIALSASSLGIVIPVMKDAGQVGTPFGQLVVAGASIAEIATIVLLSLFFSGEASGICAKLVLPRPIRAVRDRGRRRRPRRRAVDAHLSDAPAPTGHDSGHSHPRVVPLAHPLRRACRAARP
jgi:Kef-type K+ transport system membrane component KefB